MFNVIKPLATLTMIALGGVALAQETAAPATDAPADPQVGQVYVKETSGDWELRCLKVESGDEPCQIYQLLKNSDGNSIMEVTMFPMPEDQQAAAAATLLVPLMTRLSEGIMIQVDDADPRRYPIEFCN
ncbi:MAG: invasion associated locus B family protein, partial [Marivivens sp.]|nr:invasion associated locus B family protein [Marivivens sp.]